jgi:hypothetical protein
MNQDLVTGITNPFFSNGVLGAACVALAYVVLKLWSKIEADRLAYESKLSAKDALIIQLYDLRVKEAGIGYDVLKTNDATLKEVVKALSS